jgi:hypothetical protein
MSCRGSKPTIAVILILSVSSLDGRPVQAECKLLTTFDGGGSLIARPDEPVGQSFVACQDGLITNIAFPVGPRTQPSVTLGFGPGIDILAPTFTLVQSIAPTAQRARFEVAIPVTQGTVYAISLEPAYGVFYLREIVGTAYPDGSTIVVEQGVSVPRNSDIEFSVTITDAPVPARASTWGVIKSTYR